jgi:hypothetical protein
MSPLTVFLSRLLGLFTIMITASLAAHRQASVETMTALVHSPPLILIAGLIAFAAGLAIVLGHNVWSGGAVTVVVTLFGWITLIRGMALLLLPPQVVAHAFDSLRLADYFYVYVGFGFILGVFLIYGGFRLRPS